MHSGCVCVWVREIRLTAENRFISAISFSFFPFFSICNTFIRLGFFFSFAYISHTIFFSFAFDSVNLSLFASKRICKMLLMPFISTIHCICTTTYMYAQIYRSVCNSLYSRLQRTFRAAHNRQQRPLCVCVTVWLRMCVCVCRVCACAAFNIT